MGAEPAAETSVSLRMEPAHKETWRRFSGGIFRGLSGFSIRFQTNATRFTLVRFPVHPLTMSSPKDSQKKSSDKAVEKVGFTFGYTHEDLPDVLQLMSLLFGTLAIIAKVRIRFP